MENYRNKMMPPPSVTVLKTVELCATRWTIDREMYLQGTAPGDRLICIQCGAQLLPKELADPLLDRRDPGSPAHHLHRIDVFLLQLYDATREYKGLV